MMKKGIGVIFALLLGLLVYRYHGEFEGNYQYLIYGAELLLCGAALQCFLPKRNRDAKKEDVVLEKKQISRRTLFGALMALLAVPATMFCVIYFWGDTHYYLVSILILLETLLPFFLLFEHKKPKAQELVLISVMCGLAVFGRAAFSWLPQGKPTVAIVILAGVAFGGEMGFFVGAMSAFVSNFFFGQGPWTPWQMVSMGIVGFCGGLLFQSGFLPQKRGELSISGGVLTLVLYGVISDLSSIPMMQMPFTAESVKTMLAAGLPFNLFHALVTAFFLWFMAEPLLEKLERVQIKYGIR